MSDDLWGNIDFEGIENDFEENRTLDILKEQARLIGTKSNGLIHGALLKTETIPKGISETLQSISAGMKGKSTIVEDIPEGDLELREDINNRFQKTPYRLEIYSEEYRFRVLILYYSEEFPVEIEIDEGIRSELQYEKKVLVYSNKEFENCIKNVLSCKRMKLILNRMMGYIYSSKSEEVLDYIRIHSTFTIKQMAADLNITQSSLMRICDRLSEVGKIEIMNTNSGKKYRVLETNEIKQ